VVVVEVVAVAVAAEVLVVVVGVVGVPAYLGQQGSRVDHGRCQKLSLP